MSETILLDPSAIAAGRTQIDLTSYVDIDGPDWGDAAIAAYMSDQRIGSSPVDFRVPNREVKIPLNLRDVGATTFSTIRLQLQHKIALWQREGGWIGRQVGSTVLYADVVNATLHLGGDWMQAYRSADVNAVLTIECVPEFYGDEVTLDTISATGACHAVLQQSGSQAVIAGNHPARCRIIVSDTSGNDQHGLIWGVRSRHYDSASTAALAYAASSLGPTNGATTTTTSGSYNTNVVTVTPPVTNTWWPFLATDIGGTSQLTHVGSYRVWARCISPTGAPQLRLAWSLDDTTQPIVNTPVRMPYAPEFFLVDLGVVRIDPAPIGSNWWRGVIQTMVTTPGHGVQVDEVFFEPVDEGAGTLIAANRISSYGITQSATPIAAANATGVGTVAWTIPGGVVASPGTHVTLAAGAQSEYLQTTSFGLAIPTGAIISSLTVTAILTPIPPVPFLYVYLIKGGTVQTSGLPLFSQSGDTSAWTGTPAGWGTTLAASDVNASNFGVAFTWLNDTTATGDFGLWGVKLAIEYTAASGFTISQDAVVLASRQTELRTDGMFREDASSSAFVAVANVLGDLPRLPPSGLESRPVELFVKPTRSDLAAMPDSGQDGMTAQVRYRPSYLYVGA